MNFCIFIPIRSYIAWALSDCPNSAIRYVGAACGGPQKNTKKQWTAKGGPYNKISRSSCNTETKQGRTLCPPTIVYLYSLHYLRILRVHRGTPRAAFPTDRCRWKKQGRTLCAPTIVLPYSLRYLRILRVHRGTPRAAFPTDRWRWKKQGRSESAPTIVYLYSLRYLRILRVHYGTPRAAFPTNVSCNHKHLLCCRAKAD